jgi:hypothetical protein
LSDEKDVTVKIYLPSEIRAQFKAKCALQQKSMNEVLLGFIQTYLEEDNVNPKPTRGGG